MFDRHRIPATAALLIAGLVVPATARATVGPENLILVVNGDDIDSLTLANHYVDLRRIPGAHVIELTGLPDGPQISADDFRAKLLGPVLAEVDRRGLAEQIDAVVYSGGFPTRVDLKSDFAPLEEPPAKYFAPVGSLTGLTALYEPLFAKAVPAYVDPAANRSVAVPGVAADVKPFAREDAATLQRVMALLGEKDWEAVTPLLEALGETYPHQPAVQYNLACARALADRPEAALAALNAAVTGGWADVAHTTADADLAALRDVGGWDAVLKRMANPTLLAPPSVAFHRTTAYTDAGRPTLAGGRRYLLSMALGVVGGRGNSPDEARAMLARAAAADGTRPDGTVYFMKNGNVRSTARDRFFRPAADALDDLGVRAEILAGTLPEYRTDVAGVTVGAARFDWPKSGGRMLPGAIAEHLTSFGGVLDRDARQTTLAEWVRAGAAATGGTVVEPYALATKFPLPFVHLHYARGLTACEAFGRSIASPYQYLGVGDPLCRPWARIPTVTLTGVEPGAVVEGEISLDAATAWPDSFGDDRPAVDRYELFVDGLRVRTFGAKEPIAFDTAELPDGDHVLTLAAFGDDPVETRGTARLPVRIANRAGNAVPVTAELVEVSSPLPLDSPFTVRVTARGAKQVALVHGAKVVARGDGDDAKLTVDPAALGRGPVTLVPVAVRFGGPVTGAGLRVVVK